MKTRKHIIIIDFYGKKYRIGVVAKSRSEAIAEAMAKAKSKIMVCDENMQIEEKATRFSREQVMMNWDGRSEEVMQMLSGMDKTFSCFNDNPSSEQINDALKIITTLSAFFNDSLEAAQIANRLDEEDDKAQY